MAMEELSCPNCGGKMSLLQGGAKAKCEICDTEVVMNDGKSNNSQIADKANIAGVMEQTANEASMHKNVVLSFARNPYMPLDIFSAVQVLSVDKFCVSGFQFECDFAVNYSCEKGNEKTVVTTSGNAENGISSSKEKVIDWTNYNDRLESSEYIIVSGAKDVENYVNQVWRDGDVSNLVDIESANYEGAGITYLPYNLTPASVFETQVKPIVSNIAEMQVMQQLEGTRVRNLKIATPSIKKTNTRILLSTLKVNYFYRGQNYQLWMAGDGHRYFGETVPIDEERRVKYDQLKAAADLPQPSILSIVVFCIIAFVVISMGYGNLFGWFVFAILGAIIGFKINKYIKIEGNKKAFAAFDQARIDAINNFLSHIKSLPGCFQEAAMNAPEEANPNMSLIQ